MTLTKQEHTQLIWEARYWKTAHRRALTRAQELEAEHQRAMKQAALREAALRSELEVAQAKVRDLQKRVFGRKSEHSLRANKAKAPDLKTSRSRGQQLGAPGQAGVRCKPALARAH
ncbi:MAG: hypothetical protein L0Y39_11210 [Methylococcaceae bacterium]|nr:hypothetical protein [Methylococcaceae bacterium]